MNLKCRYITNPISITTELSKFIKNINILDKMAEDWICSRLDEKTRQLNEFRADYEKLNELDKHKTKTSKRKDTRNNM